MTESLTDEVELMSRFSITKVPIHIYHYREWRYSNLNDAVAQARRDTAQSIAESNHPTLPKKGYGSFF